MLVSLARICSPGGEVSTLLRMVSRLRTIQLRSGIRNRLYRNTGFFLGAWAFHYFPFYLMSRQRFLHHYLPAHLASALVAGSVLNFILVETVNYPVSARGPRTRLRPAVRAKMNGLAWGMVLGLMAVVFGMFLFIAPLTYGST